MKKIRRAGGDGGGGGEIGDYPTEAVEIHVGWLETRTLENGGDGNHTAVGIHWNSYRAALGAEEVVDLNPNGDDKRGTKKS